MIINQSVGDIENLTGLWCKMKISGITKVITIHSEGEMNVYTKVNGNQLNKCQDIFTTHGGVRGKFRRSRMLVGYFLWDVQIFQSGSVKKVVMESGL